MKNKLLALFLTITIVFGLLSGLCVVAKADSPNLLEMYGYAHTFDDGILPWRVQGGGSLEICDEDSADDDGFCVKVVDRKLESSTARLDRDFALSIFSDQGEGTYYYSFYVKCAKKTSTARISPSIELVYGGQSWTKAASDAGQVIGKWQTEPGRKGYEVTGNKWTKVELEFEVKLTEGGKELLGPAIYSTQRDFSKDNAPELLYDNITLIKKGDYVNVTPEPDVVAATQKRVDEVKRSEKTGIGAINYHNWFATYNEWWNTTNTEAASRDGGSVQEARALSPAKYHSRLPFFATVNTTITQSDYISGDISKGVAVFPEYTKETWTQEMNYAIDAGVDFMAYFWSNKGKNSAGAYEYHIDTKGLDGKIKMCAILQSDAQDINKMASAMVEDYWYTIDGMPVVYIHNASTVGTEDLIFSIRRKLALAQYVKYGEVGVPAYIIAMDANTYQVATGISSRGFDAASWSSINVSQAVTDTMEKMWNDNDIRIRIVTYKKLAIAALDVMKKVARVAEEKTMSLSPIITLGFETSPRIDNPLTWSALSGKHNLAYGGCTVELPTAEEIIENVVDVLNYNKENAKYFRANTVLISNWNGFTEGGWFCPTLACDEQGNVLKNADGTNKINREYLDAVKKGIELYREHEAESAIYDVEGNKIKDIDMTIATEAPKKTTEPNVTATPDAELSQEEKNNGNGWVLWVCIGGAVVVAAAAAVVVVIVLKKKKAAAESQQTEE